MLTPDCVLLSSGKMASRPTDGHHSRKSTTQQRRPLSLDEICATGAPPPPLDFGDRIVWISDTGPEYGLVKWLGKLPDVGSDWMAGVDFDNAVGSGTGLYNDHQLFDAPMNHASLVPVIGLMKAEDFCGGDQSLLAQAQQGSPTDFPQKPRRSKTRKNSFGEKLPPLSSSSVVSLQQHMSDLLLPDHKPKESSQENRSLTSSNAAKSSSHFYVDNIPQTTNADGRGRSDIEDRSSSRQNDRASIKKSLDSINGDGYHDLEVGSMAELTIDSLPRYGVIRWIGTLDDALDNLRLDEDQSKLVAGIELEEECPGCCDGTWNGKRYFACAPRRGYFVALALNQCKKDSRFNWDRRQSALFGSIDCPSVSGDVVPLSTQEDLDALCGKNRGIQGHHNSCYLDATLFAMFSCTTIFESLLHRPPSRNDITEYPEVQRVLKEEIVNPLRANLYVRADRVMHLRTLLEKLSSVRGLTR